MVVDYLFTFLGYILVTMLFSELSYSYTQAYRLGRKEVGKVFIIFLNFLILMF